VGGVDRVQDHLQCSAECLQLPRAMGILAWNPQVSGPLRIGSVGSCKGEVGFMVDL
jgi:hypothetical protein